MKASVALLSGLFGTGSWIAMTGLWVELPVLVQRLPEGWALPCYLSLVLQIANVGPIAYWLWQKLHPGIRTERWATHLQLGLGALSALLLIFLWHGTVGGVSMALYVLSFALSIVDCTSSVVFLPYMAHFKPCYLTPYLVGEGLSGLLPSLLAMVQGVEDPKCLNVTGEDGLYRLEYRVGDPRFGPEWFFLFLLAMVLVSWGAFFLMDTLNFCRTEMMQLSLSQTNEMELKRKFTNGKKSTISSDLTRPVDFEIQTSHKSSVYWWLLFLQCWSSITTFGVFPAIQTYSCLPYGDQPFHLAVTLCGVAYPAACLLAMFWQIRSPSKVGALCGVATAISVYAVATAIWSPRPPLVESQIGGPLIVLCWVSFMFIFSYVKTMATVLLGDTWGHNALFWCGAVTQGGAAIGALLMFLLIGVFHIFQDDDKCDLV